MDGGFDSEFFAVQKRVKAHTFARQHARGAFYSLSLSLVLAAGVGGVTLASAVTFDVPQGARVLAEETSARVSHAAHEIVAGVSVVTRTAQANIPRFDLGGGISYSRTAQTPNDRRMGQVAQAASADNSGFGSWIGGLLCRVFGNCIETTVEEAPRQAQNFQNSTIQQTPPASSQTVRQQPATTTIVNQYITQPVVERTVERGSPNVAGVDEATLNNKLSILKNDLLSRISQVSASGGGGYTPVYVNNPSGNFVPRDLFDRQVDAIWNGIALSNRIDSLSGTDLSDITVDGVSGLTDADIPDGITASNYLPLAGGALTGALTNSATATSTFSGPFAASVLNISTTTATSTFASGINLSGGCFAVDGTCITGGGGGGVSLSAANTWTALQLFSAGASTTNFSSFGTAYFGGTATTTIDSAGNLSVAGSLGVTGQATLGNFTANNATTANATTTNLAILGNVQAPYYTATSSTASQLPYASSTAITVTGTASTSALVASNSFTFGSVTGFLKATAGAVSNALVNLVSDVTGILPVGNGGTGWSNFASGAIPYGNGGNALATTSAGTAGQVLAYLNGVPTWTATTTFSSGLTYSGGNVTLDSSGNWSGTFDGQEGSYYLNATNFTNFGTPFYQFFSATTTDALAQGATNKYYADSLVQSFIHASTTIPKTYTANTFSALQSFGNASTTRLSVFDTLYVGGSATSTIQGGTTGTSTLQGFLNVLGTNSTSTFSGGLAAQYLHVTGTASTSALVASNSFTFGSVTGFLKATAGAVSNALVNLVSDVTGILPVGNGGTGWSNFASGAIPYGNGSSALATTTAGTAGQVLALLSGVPTWTATTTFSSGLTYSDGNVTLDNTGAWTGTFDGQEGSYYLNASNLTNFGTPFYQLFSATTTSALAEGSNLYFTNNRVAGVLAGTTTDALAQGSTNKYYADSLVQSFIHASTTIPKTYTANTFSALQSFGNASSTRFSIFDRLYVGGTATTTILGSATSTFAFGIETPYLNITGTAATSTFANGLKLSGGCIEVGGSCLGGSSSQWTTSGSNIYFNTGSVLIGTTTPGRTLTVFNTAANAQQRISYDATRYAEFYVDASGDLQLSATGKNLRALDANLYLCDGGACPTTPVQGYPTSFSSQGNAVFGGTVYAEGTAPATCPTGMIPVPPMPEVGMHNGFCVDKYEAKSNGGNQESVAAGTPWVSITQYNARAQCLRAGKHLITEQEWMAIARNVEDVGWNWNGGVAGTNQMSDGHSDNSPANSLAADVTGDADDDPCVGTGQSCDLSTWNSQRRTYKLSNDQYIWDFGGNVWEWVDQANQEDYPVANSGAAGWQTCSTSGDGVCGNTRTTNDQWYRGASTALRGFIRGGPWSNGARNGAFTLNLNSAPGYTSPDFGFRCAR